MDIILQSYKWFLAWRKDKLSAYYFSPAVHELVLYLI